jgi:methyl-accepting chemotaxis protein
MKKLKLNIGPQLAIGFGLVIVLMVAVILFGAARLVRLNGEVEELTRQRYPQTVLANGIRADLYDAVQTMRDVLFDADAGQAKDRLTLIDESIKFVDKGTEELRRHASASPEESELQKNLGDTHRQFKGELARFSKLIETGERDAAKDVLYTSVQSVQTQYFQTLIQLIRMHGDAMAASSDAMLLEARRTVLLMLALAAAACLLAVAIGALVTRRITRPLGQAVVLAERVARGDLSADIAVSSGGETGLLSQALKDMNGSLAGIVTEVRSGIDAIALAAAEIARGNQDLAGRTEQQAAAVERTVGSMDGLTSTVRQNADNARQANQLAATASEVAGKGGRVMAEVVRTMETINGAAGRIADIIGVIDDIAFQTNILALNAAVEAARAGDQGRGFAVVASEVRNLAHRSAAAAKEIKGLIGESVASVDAGSRLVAQAGATMEEVVASVRRVTDIMAEISSASLEQSAGIDQLGVVFTQIDDDTSRNAALVEQAAAAAERMSEEAARLAQAVGVFRLAPAQPPASRAASEPAALAAVEEEGAPHVSGPPPLQLRPPSRVA